MTISSQPDLRLQQSGSAFTKAESRSQPRVNHRCFVQVINPERRARLFHIGVTNNLSENGIELITLRKIPTAWRLAIQFCPGGSDPISAKGSVAWSKPTEDGCRWISGVFFDEVDSPSKSRIASLVCSLTGG